MTAGGYPEGVPSIPHAGLSPAAAYTLVSHQPTRRPPAILAEPIGARSREVQSLTRSAGIADGMVAYLIGLQRGSGGAVRAFGQRFREVRHVDGTAPITLEAHTREALKPAVDSGTVRLREVAVEVNQLDPSQVDGRIRYRDQLSTRRKQDSTLTLDDE